MSDFKVGDKAQYNKKYLEKEVITILEIKDSHCLVSFPDGRKLATRLSGLWTLTKILEVENVEKNIKQIEIKFA
jgi:hypothetical protein